MNIEKIQKEHFDKMILKYEEHYDDKYSRKYRRDFIYKYLFKNIDLHNKKVLEAMCGSGQTTKFLIDQGADVTCLDISERALSILKNKFQNVRILNSSVGNIDIEDGFFDCIVVVGGLHHFHPLEDNAINEIHRLLNSGGYFCFFEPHRGSFADLLRKIWYKHDDYFAKNETSIDIKDLKNKYKTKFEFITEYYSGNIAYLFVYNSLILRIPKFLKNIYAPIMIIIERAIKIFQTKRSSCFVICQWQKK